MKEQEFNSLLQSIANSTFIGTKLVIGIDPFDYEKDEEKLDNYKAISLAQVLKKNPCITEINLSGNKIWNAGAVALASVNTIKELNISENQIELSGATALANGNFKKLILSQNPINYSKEMHQQFLEMVNAFINNKTITNLDFDECYIPNEMIAQLIKNNTTIKNLVLSRYLTDQALESIGNNTTLEYISLPKNNEITDKGAEYIAKNTSLKELSISQSKITDIGAKFLSTHLTLKKLYLYDNKITFEGVQCFIGSNLDEIFLYTNLNQHIISREQCDYFNYTFKQTKALKDSLMLSTSQHNQIIINSDFDNQTLNHYINLTNVDETIELIGNPNNNDDHHVD